MKILISLILILLTFKTYSAEIDLYEQNFYVLKGTIKSGDSNVLLEKIKDKKNIQRGGLIVDSDGGDIDEAIKLGRIVKLKGLSVFVSKNGRCGSSCFFIYMNALFRVASGIELLNKDPSAGYLAIHRPFYNKYDQSTSANQIYLEKRITEYLKELSVPIDLIEKMMAASSSEAYLLTTEDVIRLKSTPSEIEELYISKCNYKPEKNIINECTIQIDSDISYEGYRKISNGWRPQSYLKSTWDKLGSFDNGNILIDYDSVVRNNKSVKAWILYDYIEGLAGLDNNEPFTKSSVQYVEFDCRKPRFKNISSLSYTENMAQGLLIYNSSTNFNWWNMKDGGVEKIISRKLLCK